VVTGERGAPPGILERHLLLITGKGGVGKTTLAAALAMLFAKRGKRVLVCAMERGEDLALALEAPPLKYRPRELAPGLFAMEMDTEAALREYLVVQAHLPPIGRIGAVAEAFDFLASAAPGVREILTIGKLCYEVKEKNFDLVIVDAAASGHFIGHLAAPVGMRELAGIGAIGDQTQWILDILEDASRTGVVVVTTPEETPVIEALELCEQLENVTSVPLAGVVANRVLPELFGRRDVALFDRLVNEQRTAAIGASLGIETAALAKLVDAAGLSVQLRATGVEHLDRLRAGLGASTPLVLLPMQFSVAEGLELTRELADARLEELA
jgi:anion-transporting  ArsA/GET3 family ATPase